MPGHVRSPSHTPRPHQPSPHTRTGAAHGTHGTPTASRTGTATGRDAGTGNRLGARPRDTAAGGRPVEHVEVLPQSDAPQRETTRDHRQVNDAAAAAWRERLSGPDGLAQFEKALLDNDPSALAALDDSGFVTLLQIQSGRRDRRISTLSNLLQNEHSALSAVIANLRV